MSDVGESSGQGALVDERFLKLFGVSQADLRAKGIDPARYAREHIDDALKERAKWDGILPASNQYAMLWTKWGFRGFAGMFLGLGFLALSRVRAIHWVAIGAACLVLVVVLAMYTLMLVYRRRYVAACRTEGKLPNWGRR